MIPSLPARLGLRAEPRGLILKRAPIATSSSTGAILGNNLAKNPFSLLLVTLSSNENPARGRIRREKSGATSQNYSVPKGQTPIGCGCLVDIRRPFQVDFVDKPTLFRGLVATKWLNGIVISGPSIVALRAESNVCSGTLRASAAKPTKSVHGGKVGPPFRSSKSDLYLH